MVAGPRVDSHSRGLVDDHQMLVHVDQVELSLHRFHRRGRVLGQTYRQQLSLDGAQIEGDGVAVQQHGVLGGPQGLEPQGGKAQLLSQDLRDLLMLPGFQNAVVQLNHGFTPSALFIA